ncbi:MAG: NAD(P)-dependent glycerol-3-phosphate dehydrogenase [Legionellales bacterium]|nr:NAD(P)-dependent glycerol-3-phosphate dehydrogenase [Legionellales bacterium]
MVTKNLTVIGAGSWGTAIALQLARHHPRVTLYAKDPTQATQMTLTRCNMRYLPMVTLPPNLVITSDLEIAMRDCGLLFLVVPSHVFKSCLQQISPYYRPGLIIAWATKGLSSDGNFLHESVQAIIGQDTPKVVIAGPSFAVEVAAELPTAILAASDELTHANAVASILGSPRLRIYTSPDLIGAQLGGAVKNVLAIATGISDGLGFGANARSALITRGLTELLRLGLALGAKTETLMGLAGLGDLVLTCTDDKSRNRRFGLALGRGETPEAAIAQIGQVVEGRAAADYVYHLAKRHGIEMPITEQVYRVLLGTYSAEEAVTILLSRSTGSE